MQPDQLKQILTSLLSNPSQMETAIAQICGSAAGTSGNLEQSSVEQTAELPGAAVDLHRRQRCGFPEVVYGEGKPVELIAEILQRQQKAGQQGLVTRLPPEAADLLLQQFPDGHYNRVARTFRRGPSPDGDVQVAVVSAGSTDRPVAQEAVETLLWMQHPVQFIEDVGVAGPQRLQAHVPSLQQMKAIVCVAGMEAALPSVLGGYVSCPVIGVPTSVGYGAALGGVTALLSMLTCCASNVVTVNIDSGFRGGYAAGLILRQLQMSQSDDRVQR